MNCKTSIRRFESARRLHKIRYESAPLSVFLLSPSLLHPSSHASSGLFSGGFLTGHQLPNGHTRGVRLSPIYIVVGLLMTEFLQEKGVYVPFVYLYGVIF